MSTLNFAQLEACRDNPVAAYLAKKLPSLIAAVLTLVAISILLAAFAVLTYQHSIDQATVDPARFKLLIGVMLSAVVICGVVLAAELRWMSKNCISPEQLSTCQMPPSLGYVPDLQVTQPTAPFSYVRNGINTAIQALRDEIERDSLQPNKPTNKVEEECRRSSRAFCMVMVGILESSHRCFTDKGRRGVSGTGAGFKQLEISANALRRISRQALAAANDLYNPKKKSCKN